MASHLSDIGFQLETDEDYRQLALRAYDEGEPLATAAGAYVRWAPGGGAELWLQVDEGGDLVGLNPHFGGGSSMRVGLTQRFSRTEESPLDGAFHAWANPGGDDPHEGDYPFVFDAPDYGLHDSVSLPSVARVQLAAFAHELQSFEGDEAYSRSQAGEVKFAPESFIPSGLFSAEGQSTEPPQAFAIFTGHVLDTDIVQNPVTGNGFCWARVRTLGGELDVVADPALLNGPMIRGGVVSGAFWLSGRIIRV
jgi:hypothetical protein